MWSCVFGRESSRQPGLSRVSATARSPSRSSCHRLQLRVLPDQDERGHKYIVASRDTVEFHLHKGQRSCRSSQYLWTLTDQQVQCTEDLTVSYEGIGDRVDLQGEKGNEIATVNLCRSAYYTVIRFVRGDKAYRWAMTNADTSNSPIQLRIELFEGSSKKCLAYITGPGFQRKKFWVQQLEPDVISVGPQDDRMWLKTIVATGMIAAKTQRHRDKVTAAARRDAIV